MCEKRRANEIEMRTGDMSLIFKEKDTNLFEWKETQKEKISQLER